MAQHPTEGRLATATHAAVPGRHGETAAGGCRLHSSRADDRRVAQPTSDVGQRFVWGAGIESSTLPHLDVDQFEWTQHNRQWREDLKLVRDELGLRHLRYAIPWHYLQPERGRFDWRLADERIEACEDLGLELLLDVMHFGTPRWLPLGAGDAELPDALEHLTEAMVERYRGVVNAWCPVNEPLVTSLFSGDFGFWPPHARKWRGYMPVLSRVAQATSRAIRAVRRMDPDAIVVLCDAADHFTTHDDALRVEVRLRNARRFLLLDLIGGDVDHHHPLFEWATAYGLSELDLSWLAANPQMPDVIGLDYYPHSEWRLEIAPNGRTRQRRADAPIGLYGVASEYYDRYGLPLLVTETSIEGKPINREIWLDRAVEDAQRLREDGIPLIGLTWWPLFDHLDWDGALTHRVGKIHQVGLYKLVRKANGELQRLRTPLADRFAQLAAGGNAAAGDLAELTPPSWEQSADEQMPPLAEWASGVAAGQRPRATMGEVTARSAPAGNGHASSNGHAPAVTQAHGGRRQTGVRQTDRYGIVVFSHLRWGFVWQRPQQFLSRFARKHHVLFIEEPAFDLGEGEEPHLDLHQVMPNVTVACAHCPESLSHDRSLPDRLMEWTRLAISRVNGSGAFDQPLLWYLSPMDSAWSLGRIAHRGVVYDCMDELSQFSGAPRQLAENEQRLMRHADVVFTGGRALWEKKSRQHDNVHFFGCGVEADHFGLARDDSTSVPPDIDFMARPIIGWFGVIDERVDYHLVGEIAQLRPDWSLAMVGPVVKVDANLLPHAPNLYWMGGRDYGVLPNYCKAFDVCMMCFALNDATEYINPTKALEYLATGRPVISTPIKDVVEQYGDLMDIAATPAEWVRGIERALREPDAGRIRRGVELARQSTWEAAVEKMQALIGDAIKRDGRRSSRPVSPAPAADLHYQFTRTPGS